MSYRWWLLLPIVTAILLVTIVTWGFYELTKDFKPIEATGNLVPLEDKVKPGDTLVFSRRYCNDTDEVIVGSIGAVWRAGDVTPDDIPVQFVNTDGLRVTVIGFDPGCHDRNHRITIPDLRPGEWRIVGQSLIIGSDSRFQGIPLRSEPFTVD